jgi:hypothetical protein
MMRFGTAGRKRRRLPPAALLDARYGKDAFLRKDAVWAATPAERGAAPPCETKPPDAYEINDAAVAAVIGHGENFER